MESAVDVHFAIRLLINTASVFVLIRCYYAFSRHRENAASFILFGVGVFLVQEGKIAEWFDRKACVRAAENEVCLPRKGK